ncbi:MAG: metalloregulator ArsR/SmtB family transcription factor [Bacteroidota bacterium]
MVVYVVNSNTSENSMAGMGELIIGTDESKLKRMARMMKTVGHSQRLKIIDLLQERGTLTVKEIYEKVGISQSNASQHLKALEDIEVLTSKRVGKNICYSIQNHEVLQLLRCMNNCIDC